MWWSCVSLFPSPPSLMPSIYHGIGFCCLFPSSTHLFFIFPKQSDQCTLSHFLCIPRLFFPLSSLAQVSSVFLSVLGILVVLYFYWICYRSCFLDLCLRDPVNSKHKLNWTISSGVLFFLPAFASTSLNYTLTPIFLQMFFKIRGKISSLFLCSLFASSASRSRQNVYHLHSKSSGTLKTRLHVLDRM